MKLVDEAKARADVVVVIFSLTRCSSTARKTWYVIHGLAGRLREAEQAQSGFSFRPLVKEIYPNGTETHTYVDVPGLLPCWKVPAVRGIFAACRPSQQAVQSGPAGHRLLR